MTVVEKLLLIKWMISAFYNVESDKTSEGAYEVLVEMINAVIVFGGDDEEI